MARKGLGKGLDSLIPDIYDENFDSNSTQSLEDMLKGEEEETVEEVIEDIETKKEEEEPEEAEEVEESEEIEEEEIEEEPIEEVDDSSAPEEETSEEIEIKDEHVEEVIEIVNKNPRITLWSSRSSAVFRYLRKTEPEFSISKEASVLIEEAVAKKYPEIWALFEDL